LNGWGAAPDLVERLQSKFWIPVANGVKMLFQLRRQPNCFQDSKTPRANRIGNLRRKPCVLHDAKSSCSRWGSQLRFYWTMYPPGNCLAWGITGGSDGFCGSGLFPPNIWCCSMVLNDTLWNLYVAYHNCCWDSSFHPSCCLFLLGLGVYPGAKLCFWCCVCMRIIIIVAVKVSALDVAQPRTYTVCL
jgi:hypothetical protein